MKRLTFLSVGVFIVLTFSLIVKLYAQAGSNAITPQYNTKLVSAAEAPRNWEDLLNPKWKGPLGTQTDPRTWWTIALADGGWGLEKTIDFVTKLKAQKPSIQTGPSQRHALLIAGNFKIYTNDNLRHVILSKEKGAPVEWCRVNPILLRPQHHYAGECSPRQCRSPLC